MEGNVRGLSQKEVDERISRGLINGDQEIKTKSVSKILLTNFCTLFNLIFLVFTVVLIIFFDKGEDNKISYDDFADFGFLVVAVINVFIGVFQEIKAKRNIDKLSLLSAPKVTVIRDGIEKDIALKDIVADDVVKLSAGRQICADCVVIDGNTEVNESLITGEPDAILKQEGDELLSGSFVVSGTALAKVVRIGKDNYANKISSGAKYIKVFPSEIRDALTKFIRIMGILIIPLGVALFCVKFFLHQQVSQIATVKSVVGNLIGMIPSGLVMLTSAVFCVSVIRLAKKKALAQDLYCVETLARVDVLCLDKTGTITEGDMEVVDVINMTDKDVKPELKAVIEATEDKNLTAEAISEYCKNVCDDCSKQAESVIHFSSKYKFSGAKFGDDTFILGAPEIILKEKYDEYCELINGYTENGYRVLAFLSCEMNDTEILSVKEVKGFVIIADKIRKEAPETLKFFDEQGVAIKIISGDNPITVSKIAERAGIKDSQNYIDASVLDTDEKLASAAEKYVIFGRTTPEQKLKLIKNLKSKQHTVAMTGDGVNDVLALREADCSIAMATGSDAAKNVSQLILLDSNFACLPAAVAEGRRTINNLERSASLFLVKTLYSLFFAVLFLMLPFELPFTPNQMTFLGALTIGIPSYILALEPNKELVKGKFFRKVVSNALPPALTVVLCVIATVVASNEFVGYINSAQISTMCIIIVGFIGFINIAKIAYPFNSLRIALLAVMIGIFVGAFFIKLPHFDLPVFFGLNTEFNGKMLTIMLPIMGLSVPLYVGMYYLMKSINKKLSGKRIYVLDAIDGKGEKNV